MLDPTFEMTSTNIFEPEPILSSKVTVGQLRRVTELLRSERMEDYGGAASISLLISPNMS